MQAGEGRQNKRAFCGWRPAVARVDIVIQRRLLRRNKQLLRTITVCMSQFPLDSVEPLVSNVESRLRRSECFPENSEDIRRQTAYPKAVSLTLLHYPRLSLYDHTLLIVSLRSFSFAVARHVEDSLQGLKKPIPRTNVQATTPDHPLTWWAWKNATQIPAAPTSTSTSCSKDPPASISTPPSPELHTSCIQMASPSRGWNGWLSALRL